MTTTFLRAGTRTVCPPGNIEITWSVRGVDQAAVRVVVESVDTPDRHGAVVQSIDQRTMSITGLSEEVALVARPVPAGAPFADGTTFGAQLLVHGAGDDGEQIVLPELDVSGTTAGTLLGLSPGPAGWEIAVPAGHVTVVEAAGASDTAVEQPDMPMARRAEYSARRQAGCTRVPAHLRVSFVVAVDASASMLPHLRSGALQSLLDVVFGVNMVCGFTPAIVMWAMEPAPVRLQPDLTMATLDDYATTVLGNRPLTSGAPIGPLADRAPGGADRTRLFVISDDVPPDLADVATAERIRAHDSTRWHLLLLARDRTNPPVRAEPWRDELRALVPLVEQNLLSASAVAPGDHAGWLAEELSVPDRLDAIVGALGPLRGDNDDAGDRVR